MWPSIENDSAAGFLSDLTEVFATQQMLAPHAHFISPSCCASLELPDNMGIALFRLLSKLHLNCRFGVGRNLML
jgi:hypothetical protein